MMLADISIQYRVIIGISAMLVLFTGFLISFVSNQRKKLRYHKNLQAMHEKQQQMLTGQNLLLEKKVEERTVELSEQKETLQKALLELKASQLQLIQKEKMASLGELTSGVAHEIQNPLNFVLNFGALNGELLDELKEYIEQKPLSEEALGEIRLLLQDCASNTGKILHHGRRADGIVKSMLQHARKPLGIAEQTSINELTEEYLELTYQSFRTRHKAFDCSFETHFDAGMGRISIVPQDLGYILMNVLNNAFYSMNEKGKQQGNSYVPLLTVCTERNSEKAMISIRDNGTGIPESIMSKIFQPFFTTKPTGEATGLGLSLSYDMIKSQNGDIKVASKEGEYAEFFIELF